MIMPHLPSADSTGRPRAWPMREIITESSDVMRSGCPWRLLPSDLPPWSTIYRWFAKFRDEDRFVFKRRSITPWSCSIVSGRGVNPAPTAAIIDSLSVKTTEAGGPRGYDAGKKINGRKRHALVDTDGRGLVLEPHPASVQDRDGGGRSCASRAASSHSSNAFSLMAVMPVRRSQTPRRSLSRLCARRPRSDRLRRSATTLGCRAVLCMSQPQSATGKRLRSYHRLRTRLPLCGFRHPPRAADRACFVTFETDF